MACGLWQAVGPQGTSVRARAPRGQPEPACFVLLSYSAPQESQLGTRHFATCMTRPGGRGTRSASQLRNRYWLVLWVVTWETSRPKFSLGANGSVLPCLALSCPAWPSSVRGILLRYPALFGGCHGHLGTGSTDPMKAGLGEAQLKVREF